MYYSVPAGISDNFFHKVTELAKATLYLVQLIKLSIGEIVQVISCSFFDAAETHVVDAIAHFTHVQNCLTQSLKRYKKTSIVQLIKAVKLGFANSGNVLQKLALFFIEF